MEITHHVDLPYPYGKIVDKYKSLLEINKEYSAWTIDDNLNVVPCVGSIKSDNSYNYHKREDDSQPRLCIIKSYAYQSRWFTLDKEEAIKVQQKNIIDYVTKISKELIRLNSLKNE